jgi:hypothetical protein
VRRSLRRLSEADIDRWYTLPALVGVCESQKAQPITVPSTS